MKAAAAGDPRILESIQLESQIRNLDTQYQGYRTTKFDLENRIRAFDEQKDPLFHRRDVLQSAAGRVQPKEDDTDVRIGNSTFKAGEIGKKEHSEDAKRAMLARLQRAAMTGGEYFGAYRGFSFELKRVGHQDMSIQAMPLGSSSPIAESIIPNVLDELRKNEGSDAISVPGIMKRLDNLVDGIPKLQEQVDHAIEQRREEIEEARQTVEQPFPREIELKEMKERHRDLLKELRGGNDIDFKPDTSISHFGDFKPEDDWMQKVEFLRTDFTRESDGDPVYLFRTYRDTGFLSMTQGPPERLGVDPESAQFIRENKSGVLYNRLYKEAIEEGQKPQPTGQMRTLDPNEHETVDKMRDMAANTKLHELFPSMSVERDGTKLRTNLEAHEFFRRALEEVRGIKPGSSDYVDLFKALFLKPHEVKAIEKAISAKLDEAGRKGYSADELKNVHEALNDLKAAGSNGSGAIIYAFDEALPHELFHQTDYLAQADKTALDHHATPAVLDSHPVAQALTDKFYLPKREYSRIADTNVRNAVIRHEIPALLLELTPEDLEKRFGITPDMVDDYMLKWFELYAEKNGIDSLDRFDKQEFATHAFINQIKAAATIASAKQSVSEIGEEDEADPEGTTEQAGTPEESPQGDTGIADRESTPEPTFELDADTRQGSTKLRSLPKTMRAAGLDAVDDAYDVFTDKAATAEAERLLNENGIEGSIKLLKELPASAQDAQHAILSFMLIRTLLNAAAEHQQIDPIAARNYRDTARELTQDHAIKATQAGRFTRIPSVIGATTEHLMYAVQGVINQYHPGKSLSPEDWSKWEGLGNDLEAANARILELQKQKRNDAAKIKRMQDRLDGKSPDAAQTLRQSKEPESPRNARTVDQEQAGQARQRYSRAVETADQRAAGRSAKLA
jgi:hypothetical protein